MTGRFVFFLVFVDIPILAAAVVYGHDDPVGSARALLEWREAHPWSMLPTAALAVWLAYRTYMRSRPRPRAS